MISLSNASTPLDTTAAKQTIDAARADPKHALWNLSPEAQREVYVQAYGDRPISPDIVIASPPAPLPAPVKGVTEPPTWPPPPDVLKRMDPWTALKAGEEALARRRQELGSQNRAILEIHDDGSVR